jgi:hypothetical protein
MIIRECYGTTQWIRNSRDLDEVQIYRIYWFRIRLAYNLTKQIPQTVHVQTQLSHTRRMKEKQRPENGGTRALICSIHESKICKSHTGGDVEASEVFTILGSLDGRWRGHLLERLGAISVCNIHASTTVQVRTEEDYQQVSTVNTRIWRKKDAL